MTAGHTATLGQPHRTLADGPTYKVALALVLALAVAAQPPGTRAQDEPGRPQLEGAARARTDRYGDSLPAGALVRLGTVRFRHGNGATVAFTPDGKSLLTFGADRTLRYWDIDTGRPLRKPHLSSAAASSLQG